MPEWWEGTFEQRMARRRKRRRDAGLIITRESGQATWDRHGDKLVTLKKKKAKPAYDYEKWLHQKAGEQIAEDFKDWKKHGYTRLLAIWICVLHQESEDRWRNSPKRSQAERIRLTPRIRGCGVAAKRAGFAG